MSNKNPNNSFLALLGTREPELEHTREEHVNMARYLRGTNTSQRRKEMERQLKNLLTINDFHTAPNSKNTKGSFASRALFFNKAVRMPSKRDAQSDTWN